MELRGLIEVIYQYHWADEVGKALGLYNATKVGETALTGEDSDYVASLLARSDLNDVTVIEKLVHDRLEEQAVYRIHDREKSNPRRPIIDKVNLAARRNWGGVFPDDDSAPSDTMRVACADGSRVRVPVTSLAGLTRDLEDPTAGLTVTIDGRWILFGDRHVHADLKYKGYDHVHKYSKETRQREWFGAAPETIAASVRQCQTDHSRGAGLVGSGAAGDSSGSVSIPADVAEVLGVTGDNSQESGCPSGGYHPFHDQLANHIVKVPRREQVEAMAFLAKRRWDAEKAAAKSAKSGNPSKRNSLGPLSHSLLNAIMRFGKTFVTLTHARDMGYRKVLILSHRPDLGRSWRDEFNYVYRCRVHEGQECLPDGSCPGEFVFVGRRFGRDQSELPGLEKVVAMASLQDLRGSSDWTFTTDDSGDTVFSLSGEEAGVAVAAAKLAPITRVPATVELLARMDRGEV